MGLLGLKALQRIDLRLKIHQGKDKKTNDSQTDYDSSLSDESDISIYAKGNIADEDNEKNDLEKIIAIQESKICLLKSLVMKV